MASDGCGSDLGGASWKLSSRTVHQPLEAPYSTLLPFSCARWPKCRRVWSAIVVALAWVTGSAKSANVERSALAESRLSRCSVVRPRLPGDASIRESHSRSQCRLRLLAIAHLGQHHASGCPARERPSGQVPHVPKYPAATRA